MSSWPGRLGLAMALGGCLVPCLLTLSLLGLLSAGAVAAGWPALSGGAPQPGGLMLRAGLELGPSEPGFPAWALPCSPEPAALALAPSACAGNPGADPSDYQGFSTGQCTWYVATRRLVDWRAPSGALGGNAGQWLGLAEAAGYQVGSVPALGAIAVYSDHGDGHVAWVVGVDAQGDYTVAEANWLYFGPRPPYLDLRGVAAGSGGSPSDQIEGFIYGKAGA
ncbi:MAG: CHAP domain-containing protein [Candidatus Dormibacteria bacterium]